MKTPSRYFFLLCIFILSFSIQAQNSDFDPNKLKAEYFKNKDVKDYEEKSKETVYSTKTNEKIFVSRTKFHDLQMFHNVDSLWKNLEDKINYKSKYYKSEKAYHISKRSSSKKGQIYTHQFTYSDSLSAKHVLVKNILKFNL